MDLIRIGKFIAELRKERSLTQEQLGETLGVTNKTISRWETGTYLPPADLLLRMSELFGVSVNELLSGKRLAPEEYKAAAEQNLQQAVRESSFSVREKLDFFKRKWLREHIFVMVLAGLCILGIFTAGLILKRPLAVSGAVVLLAVAHVWRYNTMMACAEARAFDPAGGSRQ